MLTKRTLKKLLREAPKNINGRYFCIDSITFDVRVIYDTPEIAYAMLGLDKTSITMCTHRLYKQFGLYVLHECSYNYIKERMIAR